MADNQDRTLALLSIAATKKPQNKPCPPENIMSAFIENRVNSNTRAMMLSHLNQCQDCYLTWEQVGLYMAQNNDPVVNHHKTEKLGFIQRFESWLNSVVSWQTAVPGLALASVAIALIVNLPDASYQDVYSDPSMVVVTLDADTLTRNINQLPAPWKNQTFGFAKSTYTTPAKAVGAGIWSARSTLMNSQVPLPAQLVSDPAIDWQDSEWQDYYAFGKWTLSAWIVAKAENIKQPQWVLLRDSLQSLETGFKQRSQSEPEAKITLQTIDKMKVSLDRLSKKEDVFAQSDLLRDIELGLQKLFL